jgi:uncharacterized protein (TIGR00251 family)
VIDLQATAHGVVLPVQAQPGARQNAITGEHAGRLRVAVTQAPEKGKANKALIEVLAAALDLKKSQIALVTGETSSQKKFLVSGIALEELASRIAARLE